MMNPGRHFAAALAFAVLVTPAASWGDDKVVVAVMPTEPMSLFFPMKDPAQVAACEQIILDAVSDMKGVMMADRANLSRVLAERRLGLMSYEPLPPKPIVAADIFVISQTVVAGGKPFLHVRAIHGSTASLLGELKLDASGRDADEFARALREGVKKWWPGVTERLSDARSKPVWIVPDVQIPCAPLWRDGERAWAALQDELARHPNAFCIAPSDLTDPQLEMFMKVAGVSRPAMLPYSPAADYLLDVRMNALTEMDLCVRGGSGMEVLAKTSIKGADASATLKGAAKWAAEQAERLAKPTSGETAQAADARHQEWARQQAAVELGQGKLLYQQYVRQASRNSTQPAAAAEDKALAQQYRTRFRRHFRRAAQLDPTSEEAAYEAARSWEGSFSPTWEDYEAKTILHVARVGSDAQWRFVEQFPRSEHREQMLAYAYADSSAVYRVAVRPAGMGEEEFDKIKEFYLRRALDSSMAFAEEYEMTGRAKSVKWGFYEHLLMVSRYLEEKGRTNEELAWLVKEWSRRFDGHPDVAPNSDFVRLLVLAHQKDEQGFDKLLADLMERCPNPGHAQWKHGGQIVLRAMSDRRWETGSFEKWYARRLDKQTTLPTNASTRQRQTASSPGLRTE